MMTRVFCAECGKNIVETDYPEREFMFMGSDFEVYAVLDRDSIFYPPLVAWYEIKKTAHPIKYYCSRPCLDKVLC